MMNVRYFYTNSFNSQLNCVFLLKRQVADSQQANTNDIVTLVIVISYTFLKY